MGLFDSLFSDKKTEETTGGGSQSQSTRSTAQTTADVLDSILTSGKVTRGSAFVQQFGTDLINSITGILPKYGKQEAIDDSQEAVTAAITQILNSGVGDILALETASGTTGSSGKRIASEGLAAKAAGEGARLRQEVIGQYAGIQTQGAQLLVDLIAADQAGTETIDEQKDGTSSTIENRTAEEEAEGEYAEWSKGTARGRKSPFDILKGLIPGSPSGGDGGAV